MPPLLHVSHTYRDQSRLHGWGKGSRHLTSWILLSFLLSSNYDQRATSPNPSRMPFPLEQGTEQPHAFCSDLKSLKNPCKEGNNSSSSRGGGGGGGGIGRWVSSHGTPSTSPFPPTPFPGVHLCNHTSCPISTLQTPNQDLQAQFPCHGRHQEPSIQQKDRG